MLSHRWLLQRGAFAKALPALLLALATVAMGSGCASPGDPTPRRPIVPQAVQDLQARQQGAVVLLSFTLPSQSTRKEPLAERPAIEIYRGEIEPGGKAAQKTSTKIVYTIPGELTDTYLADGRIVYRDSIEPGELAQAVNADTQRVYEVRTRAERNRASAESNRVVVHIHPAPEMVSEVNARVAGQSVTLTWPSETSGGYRVYRAEIAPESAAAAAADASKAVLRMPLVQVAQTNASANGGSIFAAAQGGLQYQDENVSLGHAYLYIVRHISQFGAEAVESADSKAAVVTVLEPVAPAAPQDVEAIGAPRTATEPASVSLSWALSSEAGVAGYAVYRSEQEDARGVRLNQEVTGAPTYRDASVTAGQRYFYSVTAIDAAGHESAASAAVEVLVPQTQP